MNVSILVPVYKVEKYIERCARSLFEQTYQDIEYIFVDDCSPDRSVDILLSLIEKYLQRKERVRIIRHEINRGLAAARNTGVENCNTEFLIHVDSDDFLELDAVEKLVKRQMETGADVVTGQAQKLLQGQSFVMERPQFENRDDFVVDMIKPSIHHTIWGRLIRKSLYTDNNIQAKEGTNIGEDLQVMSQLAFYAKKTDSVWDVVYYYDCTNEYSYMNQFGCNNPSRLRQDTESMEIVHDFFENKEPKFLDLTENYLSNYYLKLLDYYCEIGDKDNFIIIQKKLFSLKKENREMSKHRSFKIHNYILYRIKKHIGKVL